jgi:predicted transport protein
LTRYNSEYGKRPFREKRDMDKGFRDSRLRLNDDLAKLEHWNESEINNRAQRLAELATQVWPYQQLAPEIVQKYQKAEKFSDLKIYTLENHPHVYEGGKNEELFQLLRKRILNLDASVTEEILKIYIAYKTDTNFVDVVPLKSRLNLTLNVKFGEIQDPKGLCKDVTGKGKWGNGDIEIWLTSADQLDDVMALVKQSFEKHTNYDNQ